MRHPGSTHGWRRGTVYLAVLGASLLVTVMGLAALTAARIEGRSAAGEVAMLATLEAADEREVWRVLLREPDPQASNWTFDAGHPARIG